jgi:predicted Rossmann fold nucleotide-binding protein DprA/Smf involved in DNA uptake
VDSVDADGEDANGEDADREDADGQVLSMADAQRRILAMVQRGPCPEQQLIEACGAAAGLVRAALVRLEMQGFVKRLPGAIFIGGTPGRQVQFPEVAEWKGP